MSKSTLMRHRGRFARDTEPVGGGGQPGGQPAPAPAPAPAAPAPVPAPAPAGPPQQPDRPDGISDAEWAALGDPGKAALVRERQRAAAAEQALAAERAKKPTPPKPNDPPKPTDPPKGPDGQPDIAAIVQQAVAAATAPLLEAQAQREADAAAAVIRDAVTTAASTRFYDPTDALAQIDLTTLTDGNGRPDQQKVTTALDDLLTRKPHLGKVVDTRRQAPLGTPIGAGGGPSAPLEDRVKATLAQMQSTVGVKLAGS
jgi:hypothetical protein